MTEHRYATVDDLQQRFGVEKLLQICATDEEVDFEQIEAVVDAALADATELIDSYVAGRYAVPLAPIPAPIRRYCADIALWYLDRARTDEAHRKGYEDALEGLKSIAKGQMLLQSAGISAETSPTSNSEVYSSNNIRIFSPQSLKVF